MKEAASGYFQFFKYLDLLGSYCIIILWFIAVLLLDGFQKIIFHPVKATFEILICNCSYYTMTFKLYLV